MTKYALVTGGSRGIGRAVSTELARRGYSVIINYVSNQEAAEATLQAVEAEGGKGELLRFDVADVQAVDKALENWEVQHPDDYIAVLVNNAGIRDDALLMMMQDEQWHRVLSTHLDGFFYVTRRVLKNMLYKRWGRIVNVA